MAPAPRADQLEVILCLPTAPALPTERNGDFGTSQFYGQLSDKPLTCPLYITWGCPTQSTIALIFPKRKDSVLGKPVSGGRAACASAPGRAQRRRRSPSGQARSGERVNSELSGELRIATV